MTIHQENKQVASRSNLLTTQEQAICKQIATRTAPHSQRALALLALNEKSTQAQAAEQAGLTLGQVKYWVAKFRKQRLGIFPDTLLDELDAEAEKAEIEPVIEIEKEPESATEEADSAEDETKSTKAKKGKKGKKTKKPKKTRKATKGRKSKKAKKPKKK